MQLKFVYLSMLTCGDSLEKSFIEDYMSQVRSLRSNFQLHEVVQMYTPGGSVAKNTKIKISSHC